MAEILSDSDGSENASRPTRPSLSQVKAVIDFMQKHPDMAHKKLRYGMSHEKFKKLWIDLSNTANSMNGTIKSTKGWIKFWSDKRRNVVFKHKQISEGKIKDKLTPLEQKILSLCCDEKTSRRSKLKQENCNGEDSYLDALNESETEFEVETNRIQCTDADEKHMTVMEKMAEVMDKQAVAMTEIAQAAVCNSKAMEKIADASHKQALAVDRLANTFETINASVYDMRNAIMNIDYSLKRCYSSTPMQQRQNTNIFP